MEFEGRSGTRAGDMGGKEAYQDERNEWMMGFLERLYIK